MLRLSWSRVAAKLAAKQEHGIVLWCTILDDIWALTSADGHLWIAAHVPRTVF